MPLSDGHSREQVKAALGLFTEISEKRLSGFQRINDIINENPHTVRGKTKKQRRKKMFLTAALAAATVTVTKAGWLALAGAAYTIYNNCKED